MWLYLGKAVYSRKSGCIQAKWLYLVKLGCIHIIGCIREGRLYLGKSGCIRQKLLFSDKRGCIRAKRINSATEVVFVQSCCFREMWFNWGKNCCIGAKGVVLGQKLL